MNVRQQLNDRFAAAFAAVGCESALPGVQPAGKPEFGDYQVNGVMAAAKRAGTKPRDLAAQVIAAADVDDLIEKLEIAGPGFINITLSDATLVTGAAADSELINQAAHPQKIVVDYSAPNLAKEMHVGHLRSTIIGDAVVRILEALGHSVTRQNHVGDWGTQFGMLLTYLSETGDGSNELADIEEFYRSAKQRFDSDADFAERSRAAVVGLQSGDADALAQWRKFIGISLSHCQAIYDRLGTTLTMADVQAESAYNDALAGVIETLEHRQLLSESEGAQVVFLDEYKAKDGTPMGVIVQKSDGGFLYSTTDLAAVNYRSDELHADRVIYLTDARQSQHFAQIFLIARAAGFAREEMILEHQPFGNMLGKDGRPFKSREGGLIKLNDLLDEAISRAGALISEKDPELADAEREELARIVGIGAVKYADLSKNRSSNYIFDWDQMLSFDGNTAPYLQYAYTRIRSVFRRADINPADLKGSVAITTSEERSLCLRLLRFQEVLEGVADDVYPHFLCAYLYDLASDFMRFYEACPILNEADPLRTSRLLLADRTAAVLQRGLNLLGIETPERM